MILKFFATGAEAGAEWDALMMQCVQSPAAYAASWHPDLPREWLLARCTAHEAWCERPLRACAHLRAAAHEAPAVELSCFFAAIFFVGVLLMCAACSATRPPPAVVAAVVAEPVVTKAPSAPP